MTACFAIVARLLVFTLCLSKVGATDVLFTHKPLTAKYNKETHVIGTQGAYHGLNKTLPFEILNSLASPESDPVLLWIVNGVTSADLDAAAMNLSPVKLSSENTPSQSSNPANSNLNIILLAHPDGANLPNSQIENVLSSADEIARFIASFKVEFPMFNLNTGIHLGAESFAARHVPVFAASIMSTTNRPISISSVILGGAFINPTVQYKYNSAAACSTKSLVDGSCSSFNTVNGTLTPRLKKCQVNPALPFCRDLVQDLQQITLKPTLAQNKNIYAINEDKLNAMLKFIDSRSVGSTSSNVVEAYRNPALLLNVNSSELAQPYQYLVSLLLQNGIKVLVYGGDEDLLVNPEGVKKWTSLIKAGSVGSAQRHTGAWVVDGRRLGTISTKGDLSVVQVARCGNLVSSDNPEALASLFNEWTEMGVSQNSPAQPSTVKLDAGYDRPAGEGPLVDIDLNFKATLEPVLITVTNIVTETLKVEPSTIFQTFIQTRTVSGLPEDSYGSPYGAESWPTRDARMPPYGSVRPLPPQPSTMAIAFFPTTTTDTVTLIKPTTTTQYAVVTLPASTRTVTEWVTYRPSQPVYSIQTWPVSKTDKTLQKEYPYTQGVFTDSSQQGAWQVSNPPSIKSASPLYENGPLPLPGYDSPDKNTPFFMSSPDPNEVTTILRETSTTKFAMPTETQRVPLPGPQIVSEESVPNTMGFSNPPLALPTKMAPAPAPLSQPTGLIGGPEGSGENSMKHVLENSMSGTTTHGVLDDVFGPPHDSRAQNGAGNIPAIMPDVSTDPSLEAGSQTPGDSSLDGVVENISLPSSQDNVFNPKLKDTTDNEDDYSYDDNRDDGVDTEDGSYDYDNSDDFDDSDDDNWDNEDDWDEDDDSWSDEDSDEDDSRSSLLRFMRHRVEKKTSRISDHVDRAFNFIENGLDIATDGVEEGMDLALDGVEDTMDNTEKGVDFAMGSLRRFGRVFAP